MPMLPRFSKRQQQNIVIENKTTYHTLNIDLKKKPTSGWGRNYFLKKVFSKWSQKRFNIWGLPKSEFCRHFFHVFDPHKYLNNQINNYWTKKNIHHHFSKEGSFLQVIAVDFCLHPCRPLVWVFIWFWKFFSNFKYISKD